MAKKILYEQEARQALKSGVDQLANAVKVTLGPGGNNVILQQKFGTPKVTKDGVSIAQVIELEDYAENQGAQLVKDVASKTGTDAGDGTTTATVLAQALVSEGLKNVTAGANPIEMKKGIDRAVSLVVKGIKKNSRQIGDSFDEIRQIATLSANGDSEIGNLIAEAVERVGKSGLITIGESNTAETVVEVVEGTKIDRGYISPYFITDQEKMVTEFKNPVIFITDARISVMGPYVPVIERMAKQGRPIFIIADTIDGEALTTLVYNRLRANLQICAIKAPGFGDRRRDLLEDLAALTGATLVSDSKGISIDKIDDSYFGSADRVTISADSTLIVGGTAKKDVLESRVASLKANIALCKSEFDKNKLKERLASIEGGIAVIKVGAVSDVELKEIKDRVDDALCATRAALEEGYVIGGGALYAKLANQIAEVPEDLSKDAKVGYLTVVKALEVPLCQIAENAGKNGGVILDKVVSLGFEEGYDARSEQYCNMFERGIIDPAKVSRVALQNAASVAAMLLTTKCLVVDIPEKKDNQLPQMPIM